MAGGWAAVACFRAWAGAAAVLAENKSAIPRGTGWVSEARILHTKRAARGVEQGGGSRPTRKGPASAQLMIAGATLSNDEILG